MTLWSHYNPVRIIAGQNALNELPFLLPNNHSNWLLVTSEGFTRRGMTARIQALADSVKLLICDHITPNPELDVIEKHIHRFRQKHIQGIIALGGGSVLDAAKMLSVTLVSKHENPLTRALREDQAQNWQQKLPMIAIPTTSGTGAEVTSFATVWDQTSHKKYSVTGTLVYPDTALLDPILTLTLPHDETLYTGLDVISHALESLWNKNKTPVSKAWAWHALELAIEALPFVLNEPNNLVQREKMQQASLLAGLAISQTRTAIAHSISYPLTSHYGVPHGLACSFTLPNILRENISELSESKLKFSLLAELLEMLDKMKLGDRVSHYLSNSEMKELSSLMITKGRADNFSLKNFDVEKLIMIPELGDKA